MNNKILKHKLKKGDFIVDLNGEDTKGLGCGMVMSDIVTGKQIGRAHV